MFASLSQRALAPSPVLGIPFSVTRCPHGRTEAGSTLFTPSEEYPCPHP